MVVNNFSNRQSGNTAKASLTPNGWISGAGLANSENPMQTLFLLSGAWAYLSNKPLQDLLSIEILY
jgi:hypothetical protein